MTEYTEKVNLQGLKNEEEAWGKKVKYIHYNNISLYIYNYIK